MARNELMVNERAKEMEKITENLMNPRECVAASADQIGNDVRGRVRSSFICNKERKIKLFHLIFLSLARYLFLHIHRLRVYFKICEFVAKTREYGKKTEATKSAF